MMKLPQLSQYNEAVQNPSVAFSDTDLKSGKVRNTQLGLPWALGGGFALTYNIQSGGKTFAVRVFHKNTTGLENQYQKISSELKQNPSQYFVGFDYLPHGIRVEGSNYPIVKMAWANGETLGTYIDDKYKDRNAMEILQRSFRELSVHLRNRKIAHGDIQTGNVMVNGGKIQLVDYDGMYVPTMPEGQGVEIGHRHFQHPKRTAADFGSTMDRFSFIAVDISLATLRERPELYATFGTTGENILFTGADFKDPNSSQLFKELRSIGSLRKMADDFANICCASTNEIPNLDDFLNGKNIPIAKLPKQGPTKGLVAYLGSLPVLDATRFLEAEKYIGDRVEMIGVIKTIKSGTTKYGKPYVFINFGDWREDSIKATIWSEGLAKLRQRPDASWVGKWVSVTGLLDKRFSASSKKFPQYKSLLDITIEEGQQLHIINSDEAKNRLLGNPGESRLSSNQNDNQYILDKINGRSNPGPSTLTNSPKAGNTSTNARILAGINPTHQRPSPAYLAPTQPIPTHRYQAKSKNTGCIFAIVGIIVFFVFKTIRRH